MVLNNPDILKTKPNLKICPNHRKEIIPSHRVYNSKLHGTAIRQQKPGKRSWYIPKAILDAEKEKEKAQIRKSIDGN